MYIYLVITYKLCYTMYTYQVPRYYVLLFIKYRYCYYFPYSIYGRNLTPVNKQLYKTTKIY